MKLKGPPLNVHFKRFLSKLKFILISNVRLEAYFVIRGIFTLIEFVLRRVYCTCAGCLRSSHGLLVPQNKLRFLHESLKLILILILVTVLHKTAELESMLDYRAVG